MKKILNIIGLILLFLSVLLVIFMIKGMILGAMFFFWVLKLIFIAILITIGVWLIYRNIKQ